MTDDENVPIPILYRPAIRQTLFLILGLTYGMILVEHLTDTIPFTTVDILLLIFTTIVMFFMFGDEYMIWRWTDDEDYTVFD